VRCVEEAAAATVGEVVEDERDNGRGCLISDERYSGMDVDNRWS
jgi:hypothetical protein